MELDFDTIDSLAEACIQDKTRTKAFREAVFSVVKKGDVVVDAGTGTGILAEFAIEAGASKVYAIELNKDLFPRLEKEFAKKKYHGRVALIKGSATVVSIPEKVDVILCEMINTALVEEYQLQAMNHLLQYLKKGGKVLPPVLESYVDLVFSPDEFDGEKIEGIRYEFPYHKEMKCASFSDKLKFHVADFSQKTNPLIEASVKVTAKKSGTINGIRLTSLTPFAHGKVLGTTDSYCVPIVLPLDKQKVEKGVSYVVSLKYVAGAAATDIHYSLRPLS